MPEQVKWPNPWRKMMMIIQKDVMVSRWSFYSLFKPCYNTEPSFFTPQTAAFEGFHYSLISEYKCLMSQHSKIPANSVLKFEGPKQILTYHYGVWFDAQTAGWQVCLPFLCFHLDKVKWVGLHEQSTPIEVTFKVQSVWPCLTIHSPTFHKKSIFLQVQTV